MPDPQPRSAKKGGTSSNSKSTSPYSSKHVREMENRTSMCTVSPSVSSEEPSADGKKKKCNNKKSKR